MSKSVAPPSLTLLMCNSGTRSSEVVSALSSIAKFRRSLNLSVMLHRARLSLRRFLQINWFGAPPVSSQYRR